MSRGSKALALGVCSWSLRARTPEELVDRVRACGLSRVQLALDPIREAGAKGAWRLAHTRRVLAEGGVRVVSGMMAMEGEDYTTLASIRRTGGVRPDGTWKKNLASARRNARIARALSVGLVTFHAGALADGDSARAMRERGIMVDRIAMIAGEFARAGVRVALETGQETAWAMAGLLQHMNGIFVESERVGVNFDPANMVLYGSGEPIEALRMLLPWVMQAHVKDARWAKQRGTWGSEVPAGTGAVDWREFLRVMSGAEREIQLVVEREAGEARVRDVAAGVRLIGSIRAARSGATAPRGLNGKRARRGTLLRRAGSGPGDGTGLWNLNVGVIGLGFMGRTHLRVYGALARERDAQVRAGGRALVPRVLAVCDASRERRSPAAGRGGNLGPRATDDAAWDAGAVAVYSNPQELIRDPAIDAVSICTPTDTHVELALAAIRAGKHVLLEKPAVVDPRDAELLQREADRAGVVCMPAMCMRFWPGWTWLKRTIDERPFGRLSSLVLHRLGTTPAWSREFYQNSARTGGALLDLHVHDADLILWMLGEPQSVSSVGGIDHVSTQYRFGSRARKETRLGAPGRRELLVTAEGSWAHARGWGFRMQYVATFERATAEFDYSRERPLVLSRDGKQEPVAIEPGTGYDHEIPHFVDLIAARRNPARSGAAPKPVVTLADAARAARLIACERASLESGRIVRYTRGSTSVRVSRADARAGRR